MDKKLTFKDMLPGIKWYAIYLSILGAMYFVFAWILWILYGGLDPVIDWVKNHLPGKRHIDTREESDEDFLD